MPNINVNPRLKIQNPRIFFGLGPWVETSEFSKKNCFHNIILGEIRQQLTF